MRPPARPSLEAHGPGAALRHGVQHQAVGGHGQGFTALASLELWDPATNGFSQLKLPYTSDFGAFVRLAGVHGGMGDAFRGNLGYQWMVGGQFVGHPHVGDYFVQLAAAKSPITAGMKKRFKYHSEQYYMLVDPAIAVLAETTYDLDGHKVKMPVVWTKPHGKGRVFYSALGHRYEEFVKFPEVLAMTTRGLLWAAR